MQLKMDREVSTAGSGEWAQFSQAGELILQQAEFAFECIQVDEMVSCHDVFNMELDVQFL